MTDPAPSSSGTAPLTTTKNALLGSLETRSNGPNALDFQIVPSQKGSHTDWNSQKMVAAVNRRTGKVIPSLERNITVVPSRFENQPDGHQETSLLDRPRTVHHEAYVLVPNESGQYKCYAVLLSQWGYAAIGDKVDSTSDDKFPAGTKRYYDEEGTTYRGVLTLNTIGGRVFPMDIEPARVKGGEALAVGTALTNLRRRAGVKPDTVSKVDVLSLGLLAQTDPATILELTQTVLTVAYCSDPDVSRLNDNRMPDDHERTLDQHLHLVPVSDLGDTINSVLRNGFRITQGVATMASRVAAIQRHCDANNSGTSKGSRITRWITNMASRVAATQRLYAGRKRSSANASDGAPNADYGFVKGLDTLWRDDTGWKAPKALTGDEEFLLPSFKKDRY